MTDAIQEKENKEVPEKPKAQKTSSIVTSSKTVDFPAYGWGINAGESKELPEDERARKEILSKHYISVTN